RGRCRRHPRGAPRVVGGPGGVPPRRAPARPDGWPPWSGDAARRRTAMSGSAHRAVVRWSLRLFRREWRQHLLVLALLTVAVGVAVTGAAAAVNAASRAQGDFGAATTRIEVDAANPAAARSVIERARQRFGTVDVIARGSILVPGSLQHVEVRDQDPHGPYST